MPIRLTPLLFAAIAAILLSTSKSSAQGRSSGTGGFGTGSSFGSSQSGFGQSSFGSGSSGGSAFGQSALGQSAFGQSGFGSGGTSGLGAAGTTGATATGTTPFVGRGAADLDAFFGGINEAFGNAQRSQRNGRNSSSASGEAGRRPPVRVKLTVSPELQSAVTARQATASMPTSRSISKAAQRIAQRGLTGVAVATVGESVTLSGVVQSESEKRLAEKLLAIEPSVRQIDNQIRLAGEVPEIVPAPR